MELNATEIELTSMGVGTYWYLPPETFEDGLNDEKIISGKVDIWSTGVIFFELLYGQKPFGNGMSQKKILTKNLIIEEGRKLKFPEKNIKNYKVSEKVRQFIRKCL